MYLSFFSDEVTLITEDEDDVDLTTTREKFQQLFNSNDKDIVQLILY